MKNPKKVINRENNKKKSRRIQKGGIRNKQAHAHPQFASQIKLFSANWAGILNGKVDRLNAEVRSTKSNMVQGTHCYEKGRIKWTGSL